jgi:hypothetical protein
VSDEGFSWSATDRRNKHTGGFEAATRFECCKLLADLSPSSFFGRFIELPQHLVQCTKGFLFEAQTLRRALKN